eukprot:CAMPEP_0175101206 /NCGR_PEP_ID=MMETSP0086_2-20121207/7635_1 /TAXON_ID=136419 /ORGANISM="Unknown Unknown, Strain D1" /LENGTH=77 /DNA_ID=CAMNT_0016375645 /DNA_START=27 /DNA_END=260 /DNA_ORIENTATION=+
MKVVIKKLDGQKEEFSFEEKDTVKQVRTVLSEKAGLHEDQIRLIFKGQPMPDDGTLASVGVEPGNVIHMIAALRGGR